MPAEAKTFAGQDPMLDYPVEDHAAKPPRQTIAAEPPPSATLGGGALDVLAILWDLAGARRDAAPP